MRNYRQIPYFLGGRDLNIIESERPHVIAPCLGAEPCGSAPVLDLREDVGSFRFNRALIHFQIDLDSPVHLRLGSTGYAKSFRSGEEGEKVSQFPVMTGWLTG